jgi:hypothetical protein
MARTGAYRRVGANVAGREVHNDEVSARECKDRLDRHAGKLGQLVDLEVASGKRFQRRDLVIEADFLVCVAPDQPRVVRDRIAVDIAATKLKNFQAEVLDGEERQAFIIHAPQWMVVNDVDCEPRPLPDDDRKVEANAAARNDRALHVVDLIDRRIQRRLHEYIQPQRAGDRDGSGRFYASEARWGARDTRMHGKTRRLTDERTAKRAGTGLGFVSLFSSVMSKLHTVTP